MTLQERFAEYVRACFTGIWIESHEHEDAIAEMAQLCREENWIFMTWDVDQGLSDQGLATQEPDNTGNQADAAQPHETDPLAAIRSLTALAQTGETSILVLRNFHRFLQSAEIIQAIVRQIHLGKQHRTFVVVLAPVVDLPLELEKLFVVIEHELPTCDQLHEIATAIGTEEGELPTGTELEQVLNAAAGLTRYEAEGAFSLSLVREGRIEPDSIWSIKSQQLKKSGLVTLHTGGERFSQLGGLDALKGFCQRALVGRPEKTIHPRGVLLLGVPGTGKSAIAKALGNEVGRPTLLLDMGRLMGSLVGQSEANMRQALKLVDAMAPAVVMIDEVEKALAGTASSGQTDSGVSARLFGTFLTWLNDHESDVFVICTANNVSHLPPEFSRAERFDGVFFLDLPTRQQRDMIWPIHQQRYRLSLEQTRPDDTGWTGAEIKACCRLAALLDVSLQEAALNVVPIAKTASESVSGLRAWANGRCLSAETSGIYTLPAGQTTSTSSRRRKIAPEPSDN